MPTPSSSSRSQLAYKLEGIYPNNFGVLQAGNGTLLNFTGETLDYAVKTEESKTITSDGSVTDIIPVSAAPSGGFSFEAQYKEYDPFLQAVLMQDYTVYGTNGLSAAIATLNLAAGTITAGAAPTGDDAFTTLQRGQWFSIKPAAGATAAVKSYFAGRAFRIHSTTAPTATVITLDPATPINTAIAGASIANAQVCSSYTYNGTTMKSWSLEVGALDANVFRQYLGQIVGKYDLNLSAAGIVTGSFDFMGKSMELKTATGMGIPAVSQTFSPANATRGVFEIFENGSAVSTSTFVKSLSLTIDRTLRAQDAVGVFGNAGIAPGTCRVTGKLTVYLTDTVMYQKLLDGTASSLAIPLLDQDGNGYVYVIPRMKYTAAKTNVGGQDQDNMLDLDFTAIKDTTAGAPTLGKTVALYRV